MKQGCSFSPLLFGIDLVMLARETRQENEIKNIEFGKEEIRLFFFADTIIIGNAGKKQGIYKKSFK